MAIEDAWVLSDQLDHDDDPARALADYTRRRLPRTSKVQAESRRDATRFHHSSTLHYRPLQLAAKLRPHMLTERFDWLYRADVTR